MIHGHGDECVNDIRANFSSNVWYAAKHEALFAHLSTHMHCIANYPEADALSLREKIATKEEISAEKLIACNGSVEGIYLVAQCFAGAKTLIVAPTFAEYADAAKMHQHTIKYCKAIDLENELTTQNYDTVWICNPNNPDGHYFEKEKLASMMRKHSECVFIIDQAYKAFSNKPYFEAKELQNFGNIILLESLTKHYAIPGLRLGYIVANECLSAKLREYQIPWSVNSLAIEAGKFLIDNYQAINTNEWLSESQRLQNAIAQMSKFEIQKSVTPFFLIKIKQGTAAELKCFLLQNKILVRNATNFESIEGEWIRVCALNQEKNNLLLEKLQQWT